MIHAGTASRVTADMDGHRLVVTVTDAGRHGVPRASAVDLDVIGIGGRGLAVVDALSVKWDSESRADGNVVWFEFTLELTGAGAAFPGNDLPQAAS